MGKKGLTIPVTLAMTTLLSAADPNIEELRRMSARLTPVELRADTGKLSPGDREALKKLIEAARVIDCIFLEQLWGGNLALETKLKADQSALGKARFDYYWLNKGPWSDLDAHKAFLPGVPDIKPQGAAFYPDGLTREQFEIVRSEELRSNNSREHQTNKEQSENGTGAVQPRPQRLCGLPTFLSSFNTGHDIRNLWH